MEMLWKAYVSHSNITRGKKRIVSTDASARNRQASLFVGTIFLFLGIESML
jgi:hypothetical protein